MPRLANARLPGSYINHYKANGGAVIPQFGYPTDQQAIDVLQKAYGPDCKVVGVPGGTREVLLNAGTTCEGVLVNRPACKWMQLLTQQAAVSKHRGTYPALSYKTCWCWCTRTPRSFPTAATMLGQQT